MIGTANLLLDDGRSALVRSEEELQRLASQGGGVLSVVPLARVKDEVDDAILNLRRSHQPPEGGQPSDMGRHRQTGGEG